MKRFIYICLSAGLICVLVSVLSSIMIDPYNVFHKENIRDNGIEPNKNYIKINYLTDHPDRFDSLIIGSSHVGALHVERMLEEHCYNMTCPEQLPCEQLENIKSLISNGVVPQKIYLGVDSWSYRGDPEKHKKDKRTISYESLQNKYNLIKNYVDPHNALFSLAVSLRHTKDSGFIKEFYAYGWMIDYDMPVSYDWNNVDEYEYGVTNRLNETLSEISAYCELCKENDIELIIFINPYCDNGFRDDLENDYLEFLSRLVEIHPFYNFAGINTYTENYNNFIDPSHYNAYLGDMMLDVLMGEKDADVDSTWGMFVSKEKVNQFIRMMLQ